MLLPKLDNFWLELVACVATGFLAAQVAIIRKRGWRFGIGSVLIITALLAVL